MNLCGLFVIGLLVFVACRVALCLCCCLVWVGADVVAGVVLLFGDLFCWLLSLLLVLY